MNLTILSYSLFSLYSSSPLFIGRNNIISYSHFTYFFPTIVYNPEKLHLDKSLFSHGIGSIVISNANNLIKSENQRTTISDNYYDNKNFSRISSVNDTLIIIQDCIFNQIKSENDPFIDISKNVKGLPTFYITSCIFQSCESGNSILSINAKAVTISHICCSDLRSCGSRDNKDLFLYSKPPSGSFVQFIFSTIYGSNDDTLSRHIVQFDGRASTRFQCINISNFIQKQRNPESILLFHHPICLNMMMNTLYNLSSNQIINFNIQDGDKSYAHYIGTNNFFDNSVTDSFLYFDMNDNTAVFFDNCVFANKEPTKFFIQNDNRDVNITINNCVFKTNAIIPDYLIIQNSKVYNNPTSIGLAHFITANACKGEEFDNAYGCQKGNCPDAMGCAENAFDFKDGDPTYTQKFHPDIDTPTPVPTDYFSKSDVFTKTHKFTESSEFSKSFDFSKSTSFTSSSAFSESLKFTNSLKFSMSSKFSESSKFTKSSIFSKSSQFTESYKFSETLKFTKSSIFSKSSQFTESRVFSETLKFTKSSMFSDSDTFEKVPKPTASNAFSKSSTFSVSFFFSNSNEFSLSDIFVPINAGKSENNSKKTAIIAGAASAAGAAVIAAAVAIFFIKRPHVPAEKVMETLDDDHQTINNPNSLYDNQAEEDPFKDDFVNPT